MVNITVGWEYLSIQLGNCITKDHIKVADTLDDNHAPDIIDEYYVSGWVWYKEDYGRIFIHCGSDNVVKYCGIEGSDGDRMFNIIGGKHLHVLSSNIFHPMVHDCNPNKIGASNRHFQNQYGKTQPIVLKFESILILWDQTIKRTDMV